MPPVPLLTVPCVPPPPLLSPPLAPPPVLPLPSFLSLLPPRSHSLSVPRPLHPLPPPPPAVQQFLLFVFLLFLLLLFVLLLILCDGVITAWLVGCLGLSER